MSQLTKKAIINSFVKLLNQKPLDKITVKDIVEDCGINRKTFYYHFEDIYALLRCILLEEREKFKLSQHEDETLEECIFRIIDFVLNNKKAVQHIFVSVDRDVLEKALYDAAYPQIFEFIKDKSQNVKHNEDDLLLLGALYTAAFVGAMVHWLKDGLTENTEAIVKRICVMFEGSVEFALNNLYNA